MIPFNLEIEGRDAGHCASMSVTNSPLSREFRAVDGGYVHDALRLAVKEKGDRLSIQNFSDKDICVRRFSKFMELPLAGADCGQIRAYWFACSWQAEFQYHSATFRELDIYPVSAHPVAKSFSLVSRGSYTTHAYFPFFAVENLKSGETLWCSSAFSGSWKLETGVRVDCIYLDAAAVDARELGAPLVLKAGETYRTEPFLWGVAKGGFSEACRARIRELRRRTGSRCSPVVFNDYMNCLWAHPDRERLLSLIDAAAAAGAEVFCIDDGWYLEDENDRAGKMGDWIASPTLFGEGGLKEVVGAIRAKGMRAGLWLEPEVCGERSDLYRKGDPWFLCRNGVRVGGGDRVFLNLTDPDATEYVRGIIRTYYDMGVRYFKFDYNACFEGGEKEEALCRAVREFYRSVREEFPDLLLENCASGAMRCDEGMLSIFHLQSVSDQEFALDLPSVVVGALACIPPETAGIWAYPYPHLFTDFFAGRPFNASDLSEEDVIFPLVTGLAGTPCLSGRIDEMSTAHARYVKEAVSLHRRLRAFKARALPRFPLGFQPICADHAPQCLLLEDGKEGLLFVWRRLGEEEIVLPLAFAGASLLFPAGTPCAISCEEEKTVVRLPQTNCARLFRVRMKEGQT